MTDDPAFVVVRERQPSGDVGPCAYHSCGNRATWITEGYAYGVHVTAFTCAAHRLTDHNPDEAE